MKKIPHTNEKIPNTGLVKYTFPIFSWKTCSICNNEYKLELMRVVYDTTFSVRVNGISYHRYKYFCIRCSDSHVDAYWKYLYHMNYIFASLTSVSHKEKV